MIGCMESYDPATEDWTANTEQFDHYVLANDISEEKKVVATFLTMVGPKTYNLLRYLLQPTKPSEVKYFELQETLQNHYNLKPLVIAERFRSHKRDQREGESVSEYVTALKKLSEKCAFNTFLDEAIARQICVWPKE